MNDRDETSPVPRADLLRVSGAQSRFMQLLDGLDDAGVGRSTTLPGWTVGHLLTHVARNADSHVRRAEGAARGEVVEQYPGGYSERSREIETGASRSAAEIVADVRHSAERVEAIWEATPQSVWLNVTRDAGGAERPLRALPGRRWQELEVHSVDLGLGFTHGDWPDDFVNVWLPKLRASLPGRLPPGAEAPTALDERDELAWLYGRWTAPGLPVLAPWG